MFAWEFLRGQRGQHRLWNVLHHQAGIFSPELHGPPSYYTPDWDAARQSVEKLAALRPTAIAPGHGLPMCGDEVADQLRKLAINFDRIAIPDHGKYVHKTTTG